MFVFVGMLANMAIQNSPNINTCLKVFKLVLLAFLVIDVIIDFVNHKIEINLFLIITAIASMITLFVAKVPHMCVLLLLLIVMSKYEFKVILKVITIIFEIGFVIIIGFSAVGIIPNLIIMRGETVRYSLGFGYVTTPLAYFLFIVLMNFMLYGTDIKYKTLFYYLTIGILLNFLTDARGDFYLTLFVILIMVICKLLKNIRKNASKNLKLNKPFEIVICSLPFAFLIISILCIYLYSNGNPLMIKLDQILSDRMLVSSRFIEKCKITLFGNKIDSNAIFGTYIENNVIHQTENYAFLDNSFLSI